jgi:hypothetical protein
VITLSHVNWFKFYDDEMMDMRLMCMPPESRWVWIAVLSIANRSPVQDSLYLTVGVPCTDVDIANGCNIPISIVEDALSILVRYRMVRKENGVYTVCGFGSKYKATGVSTDRTRAYKERKKKNGDTPNGHAKYERAVKERDGNACVYCGSTDTLVLDHSIPVLQGGDDAPMNLVTACKSCN